MFTLNFGNLGRKDKQKQQWAAAVGYLVAIVAALVVAPFCCCLDVVAAGESTGRTTTTRRCCQRKDEGRRTRGGKCPWVGEELQTTENNRYEQTFLYLWVRRGRGAAWCVRLLYIYNELCEMMSVRYTWEIFKCLLALCTRSPLGTRSLPVCKWDGSNLMH